MGHEENERKFEQAFEQALERHLRRDGVGARNEAEVRADVRDETGGTVTCPDTGTLAAFHEGLLLSKEMNATTEHIAGCSRCQQILLHLEATDEIPLAVEAENELKMREPVLSAGTLDVDYGAKQAPGVTNARQLKPPPKAPQDISRGRGFKALRWAAPAGAIAAGLLIWIVARDGKIQAPGRFDKVQVAQEQRTDEPLAAPRALPAAPPPEPVTKTKQLNERRKDNGRFKQPAEEPGALRAPERALSDSIASRAELGSGNRTSGSNAPQVSRESRDEALQAAGPVVPESRPPSEAKDVVASTGPAAAPKASGDARARSAAPTAEAAKADAKQSANANATQSVETSANGDIAQQVVAMDKLELTPSLKKGAFENAKIILAPKGKVRWRLLSGGGIERSSDSGVTWLPQDSGVNVELIAGSAPSNTVCWIIGRAGTILKTIDGGSHWSKVAWPNPEEINGIQGIDGMHAIAYDGTAGIPGRFATNDGGVTWFRTNK
jgi:photosystem II stability/assembly factor-like uncharacterized protein